MLPWPAQVNLDVFLPKSLKEFEDFAAAIVSQYVVVHKDNKNYKAFLKALIKVPGVCAAGGLGGVRSRPTLLRGRGPGGRCAGVTTPFRQSSRSHGCRGMPRVRCAQHGAWLDQAAAAWWLPVWAGVCRARARP